MYSSAGYMDELVGVRVYVCSFNQRRHRQTSADMHTSTGIW